MARVVVESEDRNMLMPIDRDDEGGTTAWCPICQRSFTDRGGFEDAVEAAIVHVGQHEANGDTR